mmetsp:Transcript_25410/g.76523  ORF Transcript_25410/g.76523 Transcript_25410/m.76523 type:complete len:282 (+) Transcript_25410:1376-2221(+)
MLSSSGARNAGRSAAQRAASSAAPSRRGRARGIDPGRAAAQRASSAAHTTCGLGRGIWLGLLREDRSGWACEASAGVCAARAGRTRRLTFLNSATVQAHRQLKVLHVAPTIAHRAVHDDELESRNIDRARVRVHADDHVRHGLLHRHRHLRGSPPGAQGHALGRRVAIPLHARHNLRSLHCLRFRKHRGARAPALRDVPRRRHVDILHLRMPRKRLALAHLDDLLELPRHRHDAVPSLGIRAAAAGVAQRRHQGQLLIDRPHARRGDAPRDRGVATPPHAA